MPPLTAYAGDDLLDLALRLAFEQERDRFGGSGVLGGVSYAFDVTEPPTARLVADGSDHDVVIEIAHVEIRAKIGPVGVSRVVALRAIAGIELEDGALRLTRLGVSAGSARTVDRVVARLLDARVIPAVRDALASAPIPRLAHVFATGLVAEVTDLEVLDGRALAVGASLRGAGDVAPADALDDADLASLRRGEPGVASVIAMVSGEAVGALLAASMPPIAERFERSVREGRVDVAVRGSVSASPPVLDVRGGVGTARVTLSFGGLQGGVRLPLAGWVWLPLPAPTVDAVLAHALSTDDRRASITLSGIETIALRVALPPRLRSFEGAVQRLLDRIVRAFRGRLEDAVVGRALDLFELPDTGPGLGDGVTLAFEPDGLGYVGRSVRAAIRVRIVP